MIKDIIMVLGACVVTLIGVFLILYAVAWSAVWLKGLLG
jgi:hypothetical protein